MATRIPPIRSYMTATPVTVGAADPAVLAERMMHERGIRHLPVLRRGKIVGVLSIRDIEIARGLRDIDAAAFQKLKVADVMTDVPYVVEADTPMDIVTKFMADNRLGSAVVVENKKLAGIFTTIDALRAISDLLHERMTDPR